MEAELRLCMGGLSMNVAASQEHRAGDPSPDPSVGTSEPPALPQPRGEGSTPAQPSSDSRSWSQPVCRINISCAQAVHLTLFRSSAPELRARSSEFSSAPPWSHHRRGAPPAPWDPSSPALLDAGKGWGGNIPSCRCLGVTLLSPLRFGVGGAGGEGSLRRALAFVPPRDPLLIILDEPR